MLFFVLKVSQMTSKQTMAITTRCRAVGRREERQKRRKRQEKKLKAFCPPLWRQGGCTVCVCASHPKVEATLLFLPADCRTLFTPVLPGQRHLFLEENIFLPLPIYINPTSINIQTKSAATTTPSGFTRAVRTADVSRDPAWKLKSGGYQLRGCTVRAGQNSKEQIWILQYWQLWIFSLYFSQWS